MQNAIPGRTVRLIHQMRDHFQKAYDIYIESPDETMRKRGYEKTGPRSYSKEYDADVVIEMLGTRFVPIQLSLEIPACRGDLPHCREANGCCSECRHTNNLSKKNMNNDYMDMNNL